MVRVTIDLDDEIEKRMTARAKAMKISTSKWIAEAIRQKLVDEWPENVREMAGSWEDFPTLEEIRETGQRDVAREVL
jgi:predicted transcriptional regulator